MKTISSALIAALFAVSMFAVPSQENDRYQRKVRVLATIECSPDINKCGSRRA
jgi:hypothetical protein